MQTYIRILDLGMMGRPMARKLIGAGYIVQDGIVQLSPKIYLMGYLYVKIWRRLLERMWAS